MAWYESQGYDRKEAMKKAAKDRGNQPQRTLSHVALICYTNKNRRIFWTLRIWRKIRKPYYITTAIAYASASRTLEIPMRIILADAIARFKREENFDVYFQTGTDEHGQKIEGKAKDAGMTPQAYVDQVSAEIKRIWDLMNTSYDRFMLEPSSPRRRQVEAIKVYEQGDIYKSSYEGLYCTPCESFWTESQLVDGKCPTCGREVKQASEEAYFSA